MAQHRIPTFLSKEFNRLSKKDKDELLFKLEAWRESQITQALMEYIEGSIVHDEAVEDKAIFSNEFETIQDYAWHKGNRHALRGLKKQLERDE